MSDELQNAAWREVRERNRARRRQRADRLMHELRDAVAANQCEIEPVGDHWRVMASGITADFWLTTGTVRVMNHDPSQRPMFARGTTVHGVAELLGILKRTRKLRAREDNKP